ncbi:MAG: hypothetical protein HOD63_04130 [Bacteroidetes bacterium]|jgi:hypothetical protein|nr:hypothetical protein [Bacteroidota bacterium]MBT5529216.1 hypothetical protein [Cytophagia bacterium]MBT3424365.1 hypothetical protein [Bacteroidota bacterium]MBT3801522.1 hypothetical protein [Bacteroidota bacterium]MBT3932814.1 hypothetical protein [Bacteroidota bacterium]
MNVRLKFFISLSFLVITTTSFGQASIKDSSINMSIVGFDFSYSIPDKDMADRFGGFSQLGISYSFKFSNNIILGTSANLMFGTTVKENDIFSNISTSEGYLIDNQGLLVPVAQELRGFNCDAKISYLIPVLGPNPNSGLIIGIGTGFLQHKIFHTYSFGPLYQIEGEYAKGYDRLSNGATLIQQVGYYRFNNKNLGSFHAIFSITEGFTKNRRDLNFDMMAAPDVNRMDIFYSLSIGLDLPLFTRSPDKFYIN